MLKDRSPLVPIGFARGTAEFGAPEFGKRAGTEIVKLKNTNYIVCFKTLKIISIVRSIRDYD